MPSFYSNSVLVTENVVGPVSSPGVTITRTYDDLLRPTGYSIAGVSPASVEYGYDDAGRLSVLTNSVSSVSSVVNYSFDPTTGIASGYRIAGILPASDFELEVSKGHDGFGRLQSVTNISSVSSVPTVVSAYTYGLNSLSQRTAMQMNFGGQGIDSTWHYQYDAKGQLTNAWKTANGAIMPGRHYGYEFDDIGNRVQTTRGNNTSDLVLNPQPVVTSVYTPNLLNQYNQRTVPAYAEISGTADENAVLSFKNDNSGSQIRAGRNGAWFHTYMPLSDNSSSAVTNSIRMTGVLPGQGTGGVDLINTNQILTLSAMKTPEIFDYDDDGNMLSDGRFDYTWNAENRLIAVSNQTGLVASYTYDYQGRRISKTVGGEITAFLWRGNNIIQESSSSLTNVYCWGMDGQLITASLSGTNVFYAHDGNKNVTDLVDSSGDAVARYEFDPFGNTIVKTGILANDNTFRFSNEYQDEETGLVAYMFRDYKPSSGCWLSRDPAQEAASANLYLFINSDPVLIA